MENSLDSSIPTHNAIPMLLEWASKHALVRAVLLTSTRAITGALVDSLSDYDVILVLEDIHPFIDDRTWLEDFGKVLVAYWDPIHTDLIFGFDVCANVIQYCDGLKIDFSL